MLAKLLYNANSRLWDKEQPLAHVNAERPDIQAPENRLSVLTLFDQIGSRHQRFSAKAQSGQGLDPFVSPILLCKSCS